MNHVRLTLIAALLCFAEAGAGAAAAADDKLLSERGALPIEATSNSDMFKLERDRDPLPRDFVQQPPLIPHTTKGYNITQNFNKCMDCHAWSRYKETRATKVSLTHFKTREGTELSNISPRRYFCLQCHVPQYDAKPLVDNTYKSAPALRR
jgi:nitrate reductase (cytochrome), electron transfer subunit